MSLQVKKNLLYVEDETGLQHPISMIGSGADKTLTEINEYADNVKATAANEMDQKKQSTLAGIPEDWTELDQRVKSLSGEIDYNQSINYELIKFNNLAENITVLYNKIRQPVLQGRLDDNQVFNVTDFIPVLPNAEYNTNGKTALICFFDNKKEFISGVIKNRDNETTYFITPENASFMTVSFENSDAVCGVFKENNFVGALRKYYLISSAYRAYEDGVLRVLESYVVSCYIKVKSNTFYHTNANGAHICFFDVNGGYISGSLNATFKTPNNCVYMTISLGKSLIDSAFLEEVENIITVGSDSYKHTFTKLLDAFEYVRLNSIYNAKIIIESGTYDLLAELGEEFVSNYTQEDYINANQNPNTYPKPNGLYLGNNIHVIGNGMVTVNCLNENTNSFFKTGFSSFHVANNSFKVENIIVNIKNSRYCLHDDSYIVADNSNNMHIVNNCEFNVFGGSSGACIGGGFTRANDFIKYSNCSFSITNDDYGIGIYYHTNPECGAGKFIVDNCYMPNCKPLIRAYGNAETISNMLVYGCKLKQAPTKDLQDASTKDNVALDYWNCEIVDA